VLIASVAWSDVILHARLIFLLTMQPRNPWQMLAEPLGSAEFRLKNTAIWPRKFQICGWIYYYCHF